MLRGSVNDDGARSISREMAFALMYFVRIPGEERLMCESFGQEYQNYMHQTGRLFPHMNSKDDA